MKSLVVLIIFAYLAHSTNATANSNSVIYYCPEGFSLTDQHGNNAQQYPNTCQDNSNMCFTIASNLNSSVSGIIYGCLATTYYIPLGNQMISVSLSQSNCGTYGYSLQGITGATITCKTLPSCFSKDSYVKTKDRGVVQINQIQQGDYLKSYDLSARKFIFSKFVSYSHADSRLPTRYVQVTTQSGRELKISDYHLILRGGEDFVYARDLQLNDTVLVGPSLEAIVELKYLMEEGAFAPVTEEGTIVVNGVVASCYASFKSHYLAHMALPYVSWAAEVLNWALFGYRDTTEMAHRLGLFSVAEKLLPIHF